MSASPPGNSFGSITAGKDSKVAPKVTDLRLLHPISHFNKATTRRVKILACLSAGQTHPTAFKVTLKKRNETSWVVQLAQWANISQRCSKTSASFHNASPLCPVMNLLSLRDEITCCVKLRQSNTLWLSSNASNLRLSPWNANHSSIGFFGDACH